MKEKNLNFQLFITIAFSTILHSTANKMTALKTAFISCQVEKFYTIESKIPVLEVFPFPLYPSPNFFKFPIPHDGPL